MTMEPRDSRVGRNVRLIIGVVAAALVVAFALQNLHTVPVNFLVWEVESRMIWWLLAVAFLGLIAGLVVPRFRR